MKKFKRVLKKMPKKAMTLLMIFAILLSYIAPLTNVIAQNYGEGDKFISLDIANDLGFTIQSVKVNDDDWTSHDDHFNTTNDNYHIVINVTGNETTGEKVPEIQFGGNWNGLIEKSNQTSENLYTFVLDVSLSDLTGDDRLEHNFLGLSIIEKIEEEHHNNEEPNDHQGDEPGEPGLDIHFDGKAYVVWSCASGTCYHYFDNIPSFDNGESTYYLASKVTDDNNSSITFNVKAEYKGWVLKEDFENWVENYKSIKNITGNLDWTKVNPKDIVGDPVDMREWEDKAIKSGSCSREQENFERCVDNYAAGEGLITIAKLQPLSDEPYDNNAYVSYGDRNFKVVIYNTEYKGVSIGDLSDLNYYPSSWTNPFVRQDQFDISGTSKDNPTVLKTVILENTLNIKTLNYNSFSIDKIEALDVPENAVSVAKVNDEWNIVFTSNFYDNVVFKVTDSNGKEEYFKIERFTISEGPRVRDNKAVINADFYFDKNRSYTDFEVTAKIVYKNGNIDNVSLKALNGIDDGLGNIIGGYEVNDGKGLKKTTFEYKLSDDLEIIKNISKVYVNVEYKGSTATNYAGAFAGSGKGVVFDYEVEA